MYTVTVTSQGQITLPADLRRKLNIQKNDTLTITIQDNKAHIEKVPGFLSLAGSLSKYAKEKNKGKTVEEILEAEKEAITQAMLEKFQHELKETDA